MPERRSRRRPLLFIHANDRILDLGAVPSYFATVLGGPRLNLRNHFCPRRRRSPRSVSATMSRTSCGNGQARLRCRGRGHGMGGLLALKAAERHSVGAVSCSTVSCPATCARRSAARVARDPDVYGRDQIGWETLPEKLQRENRDLTIADIVRLQHLLGRSRTNRARSSARFSKASHRSISPRRRADSGRRCRP